MFRTALIALGGAYAMDRHPEATKWSGEMDNDFGALIYARQVEKRAKEAELRRVQGPEKTVKVVGAMARRSTARRFQSDSSLRSDGSRRRSMPKKRSRGWLKKLRGMQLRKPGIPRTAGAMKKLRGLPKAVGKAVSTPFLSRPLKEVESDKDSWDESSSWEDQIYVPVKPARPTVVRKHYKTIFGAASSEEDEEDEEDESASRGSRSDSSWWRVKKKPQPQGAFFCEELMKSKDAYCHQLELQIQSEERTAAKLADFLGEIPPLEYARGSKLPTAAEKYEAKCAAKAFRHICLGPPSPPPKRLSGPRYDSVGEALGATALRLDGMEDLRKAPSPRLEAEKRLEKIQRNHVLTPFQRDEVLRSEFFNGDWRRPQVGAAHLKSSDSEPSRSVGSYEGPRAALCRRKTLLLGEQCIHREEKTCADLAAEIARLEGEFDRMVDSLVQLDGGAQETGEAQATFDAWVAQGMEDPDAIARVAKEAAEQEEEKKRVRSALKHFKTFSSEATPERAREDRALDDFIREWNRSCTESQQASSEDLMPSSDDRDFKTLGNRWRSRRSVFAFPKGASDSPPEDNALGSASGSESPRDLRKQKFQKFHGFQVISSE